MIVGVHFDVPSQEMKAHLNRRVVHHLERVAFYEKQKESFADAPVQEMSNDPVKGLKEAGKRHQQKADIFDFMATHLALDEVYRLTSHDLASLEFIAERVF